MGKQRGCAANRRTPTLPYFTLTMDLKTILAGLNKSKVPQKLLTSPEWPGAVPESATPQVAPIKFKRYWEAYSVANVATSTTTTIMAAFFTYPVIAKSLFVNCQCAGGDMTNDKIRIVIDGDDILPDITLAQLRNILLERIVEVDCGIAPYTITNNLAATANVSDQFLTGTLANTIPALEGIRQDADFLYLKLQLDSYVASKIEVIYKNVQAGFTIANQCILVTDRPTDKKYSAYTTGNLWPP